MNAQIPHPPLDETDSQILRALQRDAHLTNETLGEILNLSASQAGRRRQRLEAAGVVTGYTARIDAAKVGLGVQAFVQVAMATHAADAARAFARLCDLRPEIVSAWTLTGEADYLLRVYCADLHALLRSAGARPASSGP